MIKTPASLPSLVVLSASALMGGCSSRTESAPPPAAPAPAAPEESRREHEIRVVMAMRSRGEITDAQALRLVAALNGEPLAEAVRPSGAPVVAPAAPTPAPAPASAAVVSVAPAPVSSSAGYVAGARVTARLRSAGSDSMDRIMDRWTKGFAACHEGLRTSHEGKGSSTAVPALIEGRADFGPMSRPPKADETARFVARFGYAPTVIRTATDALAVYLHPSNPLAKRGLTLKQVDAIFSSTRKRGGAAVTTWGDLGAEGEWKAAPVRVYSRNSASGTYAFFKDEALAKGEFRADTAFLPGSAEVIAAVAGDKFGAGYSGIGFKSASVAAVPLAAEEGRPPVTPDEAGATSGAYPLARGLYVAINRRPGDPASDLQREFIGYILSETGQSDVAAEGFFALSPKDRVAEAAKLRYNAE